MNKFKVGDIVFTMGYWYRVIGLTETGYQLDLLTIEEAIQHESNLTFRAYHAKKIKEKENENI